VLTQLKKSHPGLEFKLTKIVTQGDRDKIASLDRIQGQGIFVKEIEEALLEKRIDLAVHSLKDLPIQTPSGLSLATVTMRLDPRDAFVSRGKKLAELPTGSVIGTGSPRRRVQLLTYRPDLKVKEIRGNVDTRLRKVINGEFDGIIVAAAAMIRLGWKDKVTEYLALEHFLPEIGQGALGIEIRAGDKEIAQLTQTLNHEPTWQSIIAERAFLQALGGGCRTPVAALATVNGNTLKLYGMVAYNGNIFKDSEQGSPLAPHLVGKRLANKLLKEAKTW
jgi:hydroxymethylbilane synthase